MARFEEVINALKTESELREFLERSMILGDPLSIELIKKIGGANSSMAISELPISGFRRDVTLDRLYELEDLGILSSKLEKKSEDYIRVFSATPVATRIAQIVGRK